jgi:hypothetical protein
MSPSREIPVAARIFVFLVYAVLAASFIGTTAVLAYEFRGATWLDFATMDSHLFIFFPTLGVVALVAFYLPSCALADLYWRHVSFGIVRFFLGALVLAGLSYLISAQLLQSPKRSMWEIAPATLQADSGEPGGCVAGGVCDRLPALTALGNLREVSQTYLGLGKFVRDCSHDALLEQAPAQSNKRYCFASTPLSQSPILQTDAECCKAQARMSGMVSEQYAHPERRSLTSRVHAALLPLKIFFLLVLFVISILLVFRHKVMQEHYRNAMPRIEYSVIIGTAAALFFPLMSQAFAQASEIMYGQAGRGTFTLIMPIVSLVFGVWALLMVLFFYRRRDKQLEAFGKMGSAVAGAVAVLKYSIVTAIFVRILGSGSTSYTLAALVVLCLVAILAVMRPPAFVRRHEQDDAGVAALQ